MKIIRTITLLALSFGFTGCGGDNEKDNSVTERAFIASQKAVCFGIMQRSCLQSYRTLEDMQENRSVLLIYDNIEGFEFEWGTTYEIEYSKESVVPMLEDESSVRLELSQIHSTTEDDLGETYIYENVGVFEFTLFKSGADYTFLGNPVTCLIESRCDDLIALAGSGAVVNITLSYEGDGDILLQGWE